MEILHKLYFDVELISLNVTFPCIVRLKDKILKNKYNAFCVNNWKDDIINIVLWL